MAKLKKVFKKRVSTKKITRRKRKSVSPEIKAGDVIEIDQFYRAINRVQVSRESFSFIIHANDQATYENILKDLELPFTSKIRSDFIDYTVSPGKEKPLQSDTGEVQEFPDEIGEDGQVIFDDI